MRDLHLCAIRGGFVINSEPPISGKLHSFMRFRDNPSVKGPLHGYSCVFVRDC